MAFASHAFSQERGVASPGQMFHFGIRVLLTMGYTSWGALLVFSFLIKLNLYQKKQYENILDLCLLCPVFFSGFGQPGTAQYQHTRPSFDKGFGEVSPWRAERSL
jgi:hypothetical protein